MDSGPEQLLLVADPTVAKARTRATKKAAVVVAEQLPIAQVRVDVSIAHLDRDFDYLVPRDLDLDAHIGAKVRVRFHGKLTDAIILRRINESDFEKLQPIERVIGPALTPETLSLVIAVTDRYAGLFWDVVRSAVPSKHGRTHSHESLTNFHPIVPPTVGVWENYTHGTRLCESLLSQTSVRACWTSAPASDWRSEIQELARCVRGTQQDAGLLIVVPDAKDVAQVAEACREFSPAILMAELGPKERYQTFLDIINGHNNFVIGTRSAIFAPVARLSTIIVWDDGNDNFAEPHAPYWDAREVAALRSHESGCSLIVGAHSRSLVTQSWCDSGWAQEINPTEQARQRVLGKVRGMYPEDSERDPAKARIPHVAWQAVKKGIAHGPVLIQVSRRGYIPAFVCKECGARAVCACGGGIAITRQGSKHETRQYMSCNRCGATAWKCACGGREISALSIGAERTAEEIGRAFAGTPVLWSQSDRMIAEVGDEPRIVVATPGAEPVAQNGYRAVIALDATTGAISLLAQESLTRRLFGAAVLGAPDAEIVIVAPSEDRAVQAVSRWDSPWAAQRELIERGEARLPPVYRAFRLDGQRTDVESVTQQVMTIPSLRVLGPVDSADPSKSHAFLIVERSHGGQLTQRLAEITRVRSADSRSHHVQVRVDPRDF